MAKKSLSLFLSGPADRCWPCSSLRSIRLGPKRGEKQVKQATCSLSLLSSIAAPTAASQVSSSQSQFQSQSKSHFPLLSPIWSRYLYILMVFSEPPKRIPSLALHLPGQQTRLESAALQVCCAVKLVSYFVRSKLRLHESLLFARELTWPEFLAQVK